MAVSTFPVVLGVSTDAAVDPGLRRMENIMAALSGGGADLPLRGTVIVGHFYDDEGARAWAAEARRIVDEWNAYRPTPERPYPVPDDQVQKLWTAFGNYFRFLNVSPYGWRKLRHAFEDALTGHGRTATDRGDPRFPLERDEGVRPQDTLGVRWQRSVDTSDASRTWFVRMSPVYGNWRRSLGLLTASREGIAEVIGGSSYFGDWSSIGKYVGNQLPETLTAQEREYASQPIGESHRIWLLADGRVSLPKWASNEAYMKAGVPYELDYSRPEWEPPQVEDLNTRKVLEARRNGNAWSWVLCGAKDRLVERIPRDQWGTITGGEREQYLADDSGFDISVRPMIPPIVDDIDDVDDYGDEYKDPQDCNGNNQWPFPWYSAAFRGNPAMEYAVVPPAKFYWDLLAAPRRVIRRITPQEQAERTERGEGFTVPEEDPTTTYDEVPSLVEIISRTEPLEILREIQRDVVRRNTLLKDAFSSGSDVELFEQARRNDLENIRRESSRVLSENQGTSATVSGVMTGVSAVAGAIPVIGPVAGLVAGVGNIVGMALAKILADPIARTERHVDVFGRMVPAYETFAISLGRTSLQERLRIIGMPPNYRPPATPPAPPQQRLEQLDQRRVALGQFAEEQIRESMSGVYTGAEAALQRILLDPAAARAGFRSARVYGLDPSQGARFYVGGRDVTVERDEFGNPARWTSSDDYGAEWIFGIPSDTSVLLIVYPDGRRKYVSVMPIGEGQLEPMQRIALINGTPPTGEARISGELPPMIDVTVSMLPPGRSVFVGRTDVTNLYPTPDGDPPRREGTAWRMGLPVGTRSVWLYAPSPNGVEVPLPQNAQAGQAVRVSPAIFEAVVEGLAPGRRLFVENFDVTEAFPLPNGQPPRRDGATWRMGLPVGVRKLRDAPSYAEGVEAAVPEARAGGSVRVSLPMPVQRALVQAGPPVNTDRSTGLYIGLGAVALLAAGGAFYAFSKKTRPNPRKQTRTRAHSRRR